LVVVVRVAPKRLNLLVIGDSLLNEPCQDCPQRSGAKLFGLGTSQSKRKEGREASLIGGEAKPVGGGGSGRPETPELVGHW